MNTTDPVQDFSLVTENGTPYDIPVEGSLGLLALGYIGLMAWRQKRIEAAKSQQLVFLNSDN